MVGGIHGGSDDRAIRELRQCQRQSMRDLWGDRDAGDVPAQAFPWASDAL
jgi:hypothetical protein